MRRPSTVDRWISYARPNPGAAARLFCLPYAGGAAWIFRTWAAALPKHVEVCPLELPGHGRRLSEAPFKQCSALVEALARVLLPLLDKPFMFFGHSMGALLSFEVARQLRRYHGIEPACLFVSGSRAPQLPLVGPPIHTRSETDFLHLVNEFGNVPPEVLKRIPLMRPLVPTLRADFELCETYTYRSEPSLGCFISIFGGSEDRGVPHEDLIAWSEQTTSFFWVRILPGGHLFLRSAEPLVLRAISEDLSAL